MKVKGLARLNLTGQVGFKLRNLTKLELKFDRVKHNSQ
jgi:hypothetical protein